MTSYTDSLRGYATEILARDSFRCRYCGLDGTVPFSNWLALSQDHLLPPGHRCRDDKKFIVASCQFCNTAANRYFQQAATRGENFDNKTPEELVALRLPRVLETRNAYLRYWEENVRPKRPAT